MKSNTALSYLNAFNKLFGICTLSLSLSSLNAQEVWPEGIVIAATSQYSPNGEGLSQDSLLNVILTEYNIVNYQLAYPEAQTQAAQNCFEIFIEDSTRYYEMHHVLDSIGLFNQIILYDLAIPSCQNPVEFDDPGSQANETGGYPLHLANVPCAWNITNGNPKITVAVVDTYFDDTHDDLNGKLLEIKGSCTNSSSGHGFSSAGAISAIVDNNFCTAGSGYNTTVSGYCSGQSGMNVANNIEQAWLDGYPIINVSYISTFLTTPMIAEIVASGVTIVGASSNRWFANGVNDWLTESAVPGVIIVGQIYSDYNYYPYNEWEGEVDIYAPCIDVNRLQNNNSCGFGTGNTSFGSPFLAGIIALMKSVNFDLCPVDFEYLLDLTHQGLPANASSWPEMTAGIVDAEAAVLAAQSYQKYSIDTYTEWDEDKIVNELIIEPGGELVIKDGAVIKFGANAEVTVKRGARLIVDGSTLTVNPCSGKFWRGINIWGNNTLEQPSANSTLSSDNSGIVVVKGNSLIEKAKSALMTSKKDEEWDSQYWGGVMYCQNSQFVGNTRVAEFMKYDFANKSKFDNCTMDGIAKGVTIWDTDGVTFRNCRFYNMEHQGILTYDAHVIVKDANDFLYNHFGIFSQATYPFSGFSEIGDIDGILERNYFNDNFNHIYSNASSFGPGLRIYNNDFFDAGNVGISISGPSRFHIVGNSIDGFLGGVYGWQTGGLNWNQQNVVEENAFVGAAGIVAEGRNREMQFRCNQFSSTFHDFTLRQEGDLMNGDQGEIRPDQGSFKFGADNCFTNPGTIADIQTLGQTLHFDYYRSGTQVCRTPLTAGNYTSKVAFSSGCNEGERFNPPSVDDYYDIRDSIALITQTNPGSDTLAYWEQMKNNVLVQLVQTMVEADSVDSAYTLLDLEETPSADLMKYGIAVRQSLYDLADSLLQDFPDDQGEMSAFKEMQAINLAWLEGGLQHMISSSDSLFLESLAVSTYGIKAYARAMLSLIYDRWFTDYPIIDTAYLAIPRSVAPEGLTTKTTPRYQVYPNPARDAITIQGIGSAAFDEIEIMDILGRVLVHQIVAPGQHQLVVPVGELPIGFVILHLNHAGEQVFSELINIQR